MIFKKSYILLLLSYTVFWAKPINFPDSNREINFKNFKIELSLIDKATCPLNVTIGGTLDVPTSVFFVNEQFLNGVAPYSYLVDGNPSPDGKFFYAEKFSIGTHLVEVTDSNGCKGSATFYIQRLSTSNFVLANFKCYPNPVRNIMTISNNDIIDEVKLISVKGDILITKQINSLVSDIDLSNFSKGIYFLHIKTAGIEKIIKIIKD